MPHIVDEGAAGTRGRDGPATGSSAYRSSISSLFVGIRSANCVKDEKAGALDVAEVTTELRGGDFKALMRGAGLRDAGVGAAVRFALRARSTTKNPNGSESDALEGVLSSYSCRALV